MEFDPLPEHQAVMAVARQVADKLAPGYIERELAADCPRKPLAMLGEAGLLGLNAPEAAGGEGAGELLTGLVCEALGRADYTLPLLVLEAGSGIKILHATATTEVRERWIPDLLNGQATVGLAFTEPGAGSDVSSATATKAVPDDGGGWRIIGEKCSMSFVGSQLAIVLAGTPEGPALFAVPTNADSLTVSPFDDLGGRQIGRAVVTWDDVPVQGNALLGTPGKGVGAALKSLGASKVLVAAATIGLADASLDEALAWVSRRETYGASLASRQGVMFPLVEMSTELEAARLLVHKTLWLADHGRPYGKEAAMVKAWVPALSTRICYHSMLTLGHIGYSREHPAQARLRDVIGAEFGEGTANVQKLLATRHLAGVTPS